MGHLAGGRCRGNLQTRLRICFYPRSLEEPLKDFKQEREMMTFYSLSFFKQRDTGCCVEPTLGDGRSED